MNQWDNHAVSVYHRIEPPSWDSVTYSQLMDSWDSLSLNSDIASKTEGSRFKHVEPDSNNQGGYHGIMVKPGLSWFNMVNNMVKYGFSFGRLNEQTWNEREPMIGQSVGHVFMSCRKKNIILYYVWSSIDVYRFISHYIS